MKNGQDFFAPKTFCFLFVVQNLLTLFERALAAYMETAIMKSKRVIECALIYTMMSRLR